MAYSRWSQWSNWYVYPHSDGFISCHHSTQLRPHTWRQGATMEEFIDTVRTSGLDDAAIDELEEILKDNREEMEYFIEHGELPEESGKIDEAAAELAMTAVTGKLTEKQEELYKNIREIPVKGQDGGDNND